MECSLVLEAVQAEAAAKKALLDAKDTMRENRKRKNSSKNTTSKADKAAAVATAATVPEDVARVVAFLFSEDGGWVNGQVITISGGSSQ